MVTKNGLEPGQKIGRLTLIERVLRNRGRPYWKCICECGKECVIEESHLKSGHTKSCGCLVREMRSKNAIDLAGKRFGRLTALESTSQRIRGSVVWRCICDCGSETLCSADTLVQGNVRSCGCLREEQRKINMKNAIHFVDGTCVEKIARPKESASNTSGHRGVYRRENGKWRASMDFQRKRINLGTYNTFEEAVAARQEGEELYKDFLADYYAATK